MRAYKGGVMEKLKDFFYEYKLYIILIGSFVIILSLQLFLFYILKNKSSCNDTSDVNEMEPLVVASDSSLEKEVCVDIRGEVKTPGVYCMDSSKRVFQVIEKAGGLTNNADTSSNNLSQGLVDEMVIVVYSKKEILDITSVKEKEKKVLDDCLSSNSDNCVTSVNGNKNSVNKNSSKSNNKSNKKNNNISRGTSDKGSSDIGIININSASKSDLMKLPGIGEKKAQNIISYREENKFNDISDIKNVKGIGESLFLKIKDYITV